MVHETVGIRARKPGLEVTDAVRATKTVAASLAAFHLSQPDRAKAQEAHFHAASSSAMNCLSFSFDVNAHIFLAPVDNLFCKRLRSNRVAVEFARGNVLHKDRCPRT